MSLYLKQRQAATRVDDTEEDLENVQARRSRNRGKCKVQLLSSLLIPSQGQKRKRIDNHGSEAEQTGSKKLEREQVRVEGVLRQTIQKASLMLSEDINDLALVDIKSYMDTLPRLVRALEALQSTE